MSRYRTGGTGVDVIGLMPNLSPKSEDSDEPGRMAVNAPSNHPDLGPVECAGVFSGAGLTYSARVDGIEPNGSIIWAWGGDGGFGLWFYAPDLYLGRTGAGSTMGTEAGQTKTAILRADGPSGWGEVYFEIAVPTSAQVTPSFSAYGQGVYDLGSITAVAGDTLQDIGADLVYGSVSEWHIYAGDPTMMTGTPTFRMDGGVLKLHWASANFSAEPIRLFVVGTSPDGIYSRYAIVDMLLTCTATADPGIPSGWTLPPGPTVEPPPEPSGIARPMIDGAGNNPFIDSRALIR